MGGGARGGQRFSPSWEGELEGVVQDELHKMLQAKDLFQAYYDARRNKRGTVNALEFELDYETKLFELYDEMISGRYNIGSSICFICHKPVKREIFAADFRDRIVHHLIYNFISPAFERLFINDSYSCRTGRGTSYGIKRIDHFMRSCSRNYHRDCYILKLDIKGYFMSMYRPLLYEKVAKAVNRYQDTISCDIDFLLALIRQVIFYDPTENCTVKCSRADWIGLPKSKSIFFAKPLCGLPIGNLTSQLFGNVYLNDFDHFVKNQLRCNYYGRYVDDFVIVHEEKEYLKGIIPVMEKYLRDELFLELHRKKIYLQHCSRGVPFLGAFIKQYRIYVNNKSKGGCYAVIRYWNKVLERKGRLDREDVEKMVASFNSYLGAMKHYNTYKLRQKIADSIMNSGLGRFVETDNNYEVIVPLSGRRTLPGG